MPPSGVSFLATFAERIEEYKQRNGYTDFELAKEFGVQPHTVYRWRHGIHENLSTETLCRIADKMQVPVDYLICRSRIVSGIDLILFDRIISLIGLHPRWSRATARQKLLKAADIYDQFRQTVPTDKMIANMLSTSPTPSTGKSGPS